MNRPWTANSLYNSKKIESKTINRYHAKDELVGYENIIAREPLILHVQPDNLHSLKITYIGKNCLKEIGWEPLELLKKSVNSLIVP